MSEEKKKVPIEELFIEVENTDWEKLYPKLLAHAIYRLITTYGIRDKDILKLKSREYISDLMKFVLIEQTRHWYKESNPLFQDFLRSSLDSVINNSFKIKNKEKAPSDAMLIAKKSQVFTKCNVTETDLKKLVYDTLEELEATDEEKMIVDCWVDGMVRPKEIKEELGIADRDYHNISRKLDRKREKLIEKLNQNGW